MCKSLTAAEGMSLTLESNRNVFRDQRRSISSSSTTTTSRRATPRYFDKLPKIEHPLTKMNSLEKNSLNIHGNSSDGDLIRNESISDENVQGKSRGRRSSSFRHSKSNDENVRLPIFGLFNLFRFLFQLSMKEFPLI